MLERWQILAIISSVISVVLIVIAIYLSYLLGQKNGYSIGYREGKREQSRSTKRKRINLYDGDRPESVRVVSPMPDHPVYINRRVDNVYHN